MAISFVVYSFHPHLSIPFPDIPLKYPGRPFCSGQARMAAGKSCKSKRFALQSIIHQERNGGKSMISEQAKKTAAQCRHYAMCKIDFLGTGLCPSGQTKHYVSYDKLG